jgi:hypothetical protein
MRRLNGLVKRMSARFPWVNMESKFDRQRSDARFESLLLHLNLPM